MRIARRDLLRTGAVLGAALVAGCSTEVGGRPTADPAATRTSESERPDVPTTVTCAGT